MLSILKQLGFMPINGNIGIAVWILTSINLRHHVAFDFVFPWLL